MKKVCILVMTIILVLASMICGLSCGETGGDDATSGDTTVTQHPETDVIDSIIESDAETTEPETETAPAETTEPESETAPAETTEPETTLPEELVAKGDPTWEKILYYSASKRGWVSAKNQEDVLRQIQNCVLSSGDGTLSVTIVFKNDMDKADVECLQPILERHGLNEYAIRQSYDYDDYYENAVRVLATMSPKELIDAEYLLPLTAYEKVDRIRIYENGKRIEMDYAQMYEFETESVESLLARGEPSWSKLQVDGNALEDAQEVQERLDRVSPEETIYVTIRFRSDIYHTEVYENIVAGHVSGNTAIYPPFERWVTLDQYCFLYRMDVVEMLQPLIDEIPLEHLMSTVYHPAVYTWMSPAELDVELLYQLTAYEKIESIAIYIDTPMTENELKLAIPEEDARRIEDHSET